MLSKLKAINLRAMREILNYRLVLSKALAIGQRIDYELWRTV